MALVRWLCLAACFYPLFWLGSSLTLGLEPVTRAWLFDLEIVRSRVTPAAWYVEVVGRDLRDNVPPPSPVAAFWRPALLGLVFGATLLIRHRHAASLAALSVASASLLAFLMELPFFLGRMRGSPAAHAITAIAAAAIAVLALRRVISAADEPRYFARLAALSLSFILPGVLVVFLVEPRIRAAATWILASAFAACVLAAIRPASLAPWNASWRSAVAGIVVSTLLFLAARQAPEPPAAVAAAPPAPYAPLGFQRGVNFTAESPDNYDSDHALSMLDKLKQYGVNAIALVPYGWGPKDQPVIRFDPQRSMERDSGVARVAARAHQLGMKVFLKPQIWVGRSWPADIDMPNDAARDQWFEAYGKFMEHYARLATTIHADLFTVGVEFGKMSRHTSHWRALIRRARQHYKGPVTYCATQGPEFEKLAFYDETDYICLNNYYPLPDDLATTALVATVETVQKRFKKPVIFGEAGFASFADPHKAPWDEKPGPIRLDQQSRCFEALFQAFYTKPWFHGFYWWKIGTNGFGGPENGSHTPWRKPAMDVIRKWYTSGKR